MADAPDVLGVSPQIGGERRIAIARFQLVSTAAGACATPGDVSFEAAIAAQAPGTVARALADAGRLDLAQPPPLDAQDHWFRAELPRDPGDPAVLVFEGLATIAEIWIDDQLRARGESMYVALTVPLPPGATELAICFRALAPVLAKRRPRPRWRTRLVEAQTLRFVRTSLLGRMPGLGPELPTVGPYRPIYLETRRRLCVRTHRVRALAERAEVEVALTLALDRSSAGVASATAIVSGDAGRGRASLAVAQRDGAITLTGTVPIAALSRWWPHTHGAQPRSDVSVVLDDGTTIALGQVGFRTVAHHGGADGAGFHLLINGEQVFARGACLTTTEILTLGTEGLRETLTLARRAGMNMLRVPGIAAYAPPLFHALCDELGLMVFQDLMFANMDYPADDPAFTELVADEVRGLLARIGDRPSTAVICGGSEVSQQAAMLGLPASAHAHPLFHETVPALVREFDPGLLYVANSPSGGALPFHVNEGIGHYYGVGAYLRPLDDLRRSRVRFAAECLAFANVPQQEAVESLMGDLGLAFHHPRWKARVPRDRGAGWDFEDVRDHYIEHFFGIDVRSLRARDPERYLALGHAAVGEAITAAYAEWRTHESTCGGALVFWLRDHFLGAGFGLIDANGMPKSAYYFAARSFARRFVGLTDEGLNGLRAHVCNETEDALAATLHVGLYQHGSVLVVEGSAMIALAPRSTAAVDLARCLPRFADLSYAYRFGPPAHDLVVATLLVDGAPIGRAFHLPLGLSRPSEPDLGLAGSLRAPDADGDVASLIVRTRRFAQCVQIDVPGYLPDDDYFHLAPGEERTIPLRPRRRPAGPLRGRLTALNAQAPAVLTSASGSPAAAS